MALEKDKYTESDEAKYRRYISLAVSQWELYPYSNSIGTGVILQYALLLNYTAECLIYMSFASFNSILLTKEKNLTQAVEYLQYANKLVDSETFEKLYQQVFRIYLSKGWEPKLRWLRSQKGWKTKRQLRHLNRMRESYVESVTACGLLNTEYFASWKEALQHE